MVLMLIDHLACMMLEGGIGLEGDFYIINRTMRQIGRIAFPIFCFTIVEGFQKTKNAYVYLGRLLLFAVLSEIPFDWAFRENWINLNYQNVFFTLAFGLTALIIYENYKLEIWQKIILVYGCLFLAEVFHTDYSSYGVLVILALYILREKPVAAGIAGYLILLLMNSLEVSAVFGFLLILLYNGKRGGGNKYLYYLFYPGHLLVLAAVKPFVVEWLSRQFVSGILF